MSNIAELITVSNDLGISSSIIGNDKAKQIIALAIDKFSPEKLTGHLSISNNPNVVLQISLEKNEFTYSQKLPKSKGYVFFDINSADKNKIFALDDVRDLCKITSRSFGMEYFLIDEQFSYLIAINWYAIEVVGEAKNYLCE